MRRRAALAAGAALVGALAWLPLTSAALHAAVPWTTKPSLEMPVPAFYYWRDYRSHPAMRRWLPPCAFGSGVLALAPAGLALFVRPRRRLRPGKPGEPVPKPERAHSDTHGSARWMTGDEALQWFSGGHPKHGGVVIGQLGKGAQARLLVDPCDTDAGHGLVFGGSGAGKTAGVVIPTLDPTVGWSGSVFVLDPSCRVAKQTRGMRIAAGQRVVVLEPGGQGMNVLDWIDTSHGLATAHVRSVVHMIGKPRPENDNSDPMWQASAKGILFAVLAHMLWDSRLSRREKSLARFARMVAIPERDLRGFLQEIHEQSECELARIVAGTLMGAPEKTFGGFYRSAQSDIEWLLTPGYGNLVSGSDLSTDDLANGRTTVYLQIPMDTLEDTPEVARTIINALLRGIYRRNGDVQGRILFLLDEVNLLGEMKALAIARDNARKYGVTLVPMWQSLGQLAGTWKDGGKSAWMESSSWQIFAAISHEHTLEEVSKRCGTYTALGRSESATRGSNGGAGGGSSNRSQNYGLSEISVPLIRPQEIQWLPREARIVLRHGAHALLCHAALWFNRPEMKLRIEE